MFVPYYKIPFLSFLCLILFIKPTFNIPALYASLTVDFAHHITMEYV